MAALNAAMSSMWIQKWLAFDEIWSRRRSLEVAARVSVAVPNLDELILTKRFGGRPKDLEDIRLLDWGGMNEHADLVACLGHSTGCR